MTGLYTRDGVLYLVFPVLEDTKPRDIERFVGCGPELLRDVSPKAGDFIVHVPVGAKLIPDLPSSVVLIQGERFQIWGNDEFNKLFKERNGSPAVRS